MPACSPYCRSTSLTSQPRRWKKYRYIRRSISAQSCASVPPAPAWMVKKQLRGSFLSSSSACSSTFSPRPGGEEKEAGGGFFFAPQRRLHPALPPPPLQVAQHPVRLFQRRRVAGLLAQLVQRADVLDAAEQVLHRRDRRLDELQLRDGR